MRQSPSGLKVVDLIPSPAICTLLNSSGLYFFDQIWQNFILRMMPSLIKNLVVFFVCPLHLKVCKNRRLNLCNFLCRTHVSIMKTTAPYVAVLCKFRGASNRELIVNSAPTALDSAPRPRSSRRPNNAAPLWKERSARRRDNENHFTLTSPAANFSFKMQSA